ncbi:hypothetical protein K2173_026353 [Erythroxylum novogranatense]|uniref:C2H2-type domain-containing protein n=1 Tax=Erythroxylum novogranatense TaxID=1862640 RepID=A0AAV8SN07_9ROSI|nr:hypothetical protein K2173_026353 [Erythroxylum novogranatense]
MVSKPMLANNSSSAPSSSELFSWLANGSNNKNKRTRRPAGTPDPDAEVVSLSPKTLLESDQYVCEICNQGFQRDQNLQMHRRRHKVPWKLLKRETPVVRKRVFVCPEPTCLHHDPCHALGDLVGIKKHFRRKHSNHKQWVCEKCSKGYAVQSDYKAHLKTCGTRGHSCDCGRVFSRVESFIEHQDACNMGRLRSESHLLLPACLSRTASSPSPSCETNISNNPWPPLIISRPTSDGLFLTYTTPAADSKNSSRTAPYNLDLQLSTTSKPLQASYAAKKDGEHQAQLHLSIGWSSIDFSDRHDSNIISTNQEAAGKISPRESDYKSEKNLAEPRIIKQAREQLTLANEEKVYAEEARQQAKRQIELAEQEFANAKRIRQQAQVELDKAQVLKEHAIKRIHSTILEITCHACKQQFQAITPPEENSLVLSYLSSAVTEGEGDNDNGNDLANMSKF